MYKRMWSELISGKNTEAYLGIGMSIVILILSLFEIISIRITENAVLLVLSFLIMGRIIDKWQLEDLVRQSKRPSLSSWDNLKSDLKLSLSDAKLVWILGVAPLGFVRENKNILINICRQKNGNVRVLFVKPNSLAMELISTQYPEQPGDAESLIIEIEKIRKQLGRSTCNLQAGYFDYIPHSIITRIINNGNEVAFITMNSIGNHGDQRLSFILSELHTKSQSVFVKEIETYWDLSEKI